MTGGRASHIISHVVTTGDQAVQTVAFVGKLASQGKDRDRWTLSIPQNVSRLLPKDRVYEVTLRPMGTIS